MRYRAVCGTLRTRWLNSREDAEAAAIARGWASRADDHGERPSNMAKPPLYRHPWLRIEPETTKRRTP